MKKVLVIAYLKIYINRSTGELLTEKIGEQARINDNDLDNLYKKQDKDEDDGWFSGEFPTYSDTKKESPIPSQQPIKIDTVIQIEKPVLVESLSKNKKNKLKIGRIYLISLKEIKMVTTKTKPRTMLYLLI